MKYSQIFMFVINISGCVFVILGVPVCTCIYLITSFTKAVYNDCDNLFNRTWRSRVCVYVAVYIAFLSVILYWLSDSYHTL